VTTANTDNGIMRSERFTNKPGIRISLADSQAKLPGCASGVGITPVGASMKCGIRLDGRIDGTAPDMTVAPTPTPTPERVRGYQPKPMKRLITDTNFTTNPYTSTRVNGERLWTGDTREVWIKVETMRLDVGTGTVVTKDITADFLSMGVTEAPTQITDSSGSIRFKITDTRFDNGTVAPTSLVSTTAQTPASNGTDSRSVIKLQRFVIPGKAIPVTAPTPYSSYYAVTGNTDYTPGFNVVERFTGTTQALVAGCKDPSATGTGTSCGTLSDAEASLERTLATTPETVYTESWAHLKLATVNAVANRAVVPFPIQMFDAREGFYRDGRSDPHYAL